MSEPSDASDRRRTRLAMWLFRACILLLALVSVGFVVNAVVIGSRTSKTLATENTTTLISYPPGRRLSTSPVRLRRLGGGRPVLVGGATGRPMVVNFFASWCPACQREIGALAAVARKDVVPFVGVDTDDFAPGQALKLLRSVHARYPVGIGTGSLAVRYGTGGLPTTAFLNRRGQVVALELGAVQRRQLLRLVADLRAGRAL